MTIRRARFAKLWLWPTETMTRMVGSLSIRRIKEHKSSPPWITSIPAEMELSQHYGPLCNTRLDRSSTVAFSSPTLDPILQAGIISTSRDMIWSFADIWVIMALLLSDGLSRNFFSSTCYADRRWPALLYLCIQASLPWTTSRL